jgi:O-antigen ligase
VISSATFFEGSQRRLTDLAVITAFAVLMAAPRTSAGIAAVLALLGSALLIRRWRLDRTDRRFGLLMALLPLSYAINMALTGWDAGELERPARLLLGFLMYLALVRIGFSANSLFWGAVFCAVAAAAIAHYQVFVLNLPRAEGSWNAIPFGNFAMLSGLLALAGALYQLRSLAARAFTVAAGVLAMAAGLYASLLSGSRGGWLALIFLLPAVLLLCGRALRKRQQLAAWLLLLGLAGGVMTLSPTVQERVSLAVVQYQQFVGGADEASHTSTGIRLAMWNWGLQRFAEDPLLGIGIANYEDRRAAAVASSEMPPAFAGLANLHNALITHLAMGGILCGAALVGFWILGWRFFWMHWRRAGSAEARFAATAGLLTVFGTALFSMTEGLFGTSPGATALALFLGTSAAATKLACIDERTDG